MRTRIDILEDSVGKQQPNTTVLLPKVDYMINQAIYKKPFKLYRQLPRKVRLSKFHYHKEC